MSYNVLCDKYATRQLYGYCPQWALDWDYRKTTILKEILQFNADILSLQVIVYSVLLPSLAIFFQNILLGDSFSWKLSYFLERDSY